MSSQDPVDKALIELLGILQVGVGITISRPSDLPNNDRDGGETIFLKSPDEGVVVGFENVGVTDGTINYWGRIAREEGIVNREMGVCIQAEKGVDVDGEGTIIVTEEFDDGDHESVDVGPEVTTRGQTTVSLVDVCVERDCDPHFFSQPSFDQGCLNIFKRWKCCLQERIFVGLKERLITHSYIPGRKY